MRHRRFSIPAFALLSAAAVLSELAVASRAGAVQPQVLDVVAPDGVLLKATYWAAAQPGPGVLLLHMCNTTRKSWDGLGPKLAAKGIHALALDYRGYGDSGGVRSPDMAVRQRHAIEIWPGDIDAAFALLARKSGSKSAIFGAAGGSCGVNQAVMLARRQPEVRTLALLAGVSDRDGELFLAANPWLPILGVASRDDGNAVDVTRWLVGYSSHAGNEFLEYADGGHGTELFAKHADLEPAIADWFERHLLRAPVHPTPPTREATGGPSARLADELTKPGAAAAIRARAAAAKARGESPQLPPESVVNRIGYQLLAPGSTAQAIELFELNAELFPGSANAWDSLSEALHAAGQKARAADSARRAIALLPADPAQDTPFQKGIREAATTRLAKP